MTLTVRDVAVGRGGLPVLEGVSFEVPPGTALLLRGPNGAGKTTLLRALSGLQPVMAGAVTPGPDAIAHAGHADGVKAQLSVAENLGFWAGLHRGGDVASAMRAFDLARLSSRAAGMLSAGQRRRLGLARLVLTGRRIWLLDEPTVSLDAASVALFAQAVRRHLEGGGLAVIATHIDPGIGAETLDVSAFRARPSTDLFGTAEALA